MVSTKWRPFCPGGDELMLLRVDVTKAQAGQVVFGPLNIGVFNYEL